MKKHLKDMTKIKSIVGGHIQAFQTILNDTQQSIDELDKKHVEVESEIIERQHFIGEIMEERATAENLVKGITNLLDGKLN